PPAPRATLLPYTTLFRSPAAVRHPGEQAWRGGATLEVEPEARDHRCGTDRCGEHLVVVGQFLDEAAHFARLRVIERQGRHDAAEDRKSTRLNSSHVKISY